MYRFFVSLFALSTLCWLGSVTRADHFEAIPLCHIEGKITSYSYKAPWTHPCIDDPAISCPPPGADTPRRRSAQWELSLQITAAHLPELRDDSSVCPHLYPIDSAQRVTIPADRLTNDSQLQDYPFVSGIVGSDFGTYFTTFVLHETADRATEFDPNQLDQQKIDQLIQRLLQRIETQPSSYIRIIWSLRRLATLHQDDPRVYYILRQAHQALHQS